MSIHIEIQNKEKVNHFSEIFKNIKAFSKSVNIYFEASRMYFQLIDESQICLTELELQKTWFDIYNCDEDIPALSINTDILSKILKCNTENDKIEIRYNLDENEDVLYMSFVPQDEADILEPQDNEEETKGKKKGKAKSKAKKQPKKTKQPSKDFEIPLMDVETTLLDIPDSQGQADIKVSTTLFTTLVKEISQFSDYVKFEVSEDEIQMMSDGEYGAYKVRINIEDVDEFAIEENTTLSVSFLLKYFQMICGGFSKLSKYIRLSISNNVPMEFYYDLDEKEDETMTTNSGVESDVEDEDEEEEEDEEPKNKIRFFLAPKMED